MITKLFFRNYDKGISLSLFHWSFLAFRVFALVRRKCSAVENILRNLTRAQKQYQKPTRRRPNSNKPNTKSGNNEIR